MGTLASLYYMKRQRKREEQEEALAEDLEFEEMQIPVTHES
jgi:hypothetical protein